MNLFLWIQNHDWFAQGEASSWQSLDEYGFPAMVYLNTGEIGERLHKPSSTEQGHYPDEEFMLWCLPKRNRETTGHYL